MVHTDERHAIDAIHLYRSAKDIEHIGDNIDVHIDALEQKQNILKVLVVATFNCYDDFLYLMLQDELRQFVVFSKQWYVLR